MMLVSGPVSELGAAVSRRRTEAVDFQRQVLETAVRWCNVADALEPVISRAQSVAALIDRLGAALDQLAELTVTAQRISEQLDGLAATAANLNDSAGTISRDAVVIADSLPSIERLATFVDRLPGGKRRTGIITGSRQGVVTHLPRPVT